MMIFVYFILFLLASLTCFTLPGIYFLQKSKSNFNRYEKVIVGTVIGFVIFTLLAYIFIILKLPFLILPIIGLLAIISVKNNFSSKIDSYFIPKKQLIILLLVFITGISGQLAIISPSGLKIDGDLIFFSSNGHDGPWHIALMEEINRGYPLQNPVFTGEKLVNYHFFSDIAPAQFSKFFRFSNLDLYFRFFPFLYSILLGSIAFLLGKRLGKSFAAGIWSTFFVYFVGSFGYFVTWIQSHTIGGESILWATQIQSSIGNPPQIISNILVLTFVYLFPFISKKNWYLSGILVILLGSLIEFKVYASIVVLMSLAIVGLIDLIRNKKIYILSSFILSTFLSAVLYLPNSANTSSFLIWEPWWFVRTMMVARLHLVDWELKRQTFIVERNWKRVFQIELAGFLIFFFGNLGTRFLGLISIIKSNKLILSDNTFQILLSISTISLIFPLLFLQKGVASNTIQFLQYFLLVLGVFAALAISEFQSKIRNKYLKVLFIFLIITFSVPTQIGLLFDFYHKPPIAKISDSEIQALNFIKNHTDKESIILTVPFNKNIDLKIPTPPIWAWFDTAYVSAFSSRRVYLADLEQVDIMGYQYKDRLIIQKFIFESNQLEPIIQRLKENKIDYIYFPKQLKPMVDFSDRLTSVFDNGQIEILKVN